jgi:hypothetical protein
MVHAARWTIDANVLAPEVVEICKAFRGRGFGLFSPAPFMGGCNAGATWAGVGVSGVRSRQLRVRAIVACVDQANDPAVSDDGGVLHSGWFDGLEGSDTVDREWDRA